MTIGLTPLVTSEKCCTKGVLRSHGSNWFVASTSETSGAGTSARHCSVRFPGQTVIVGAITAHFKLVCYNQIQNRFTILKSQEKCGFFYSVKNLFCGLAQSVPSLPTYKVKVSIFFPTIFVLTPLTQFSELR